jgi:hypothetical protein
VSEPTPPTDPKPPSQITTGPGSMRRMSGPPGDPFAGVDRIARLQTMAAILLGLVLIAIPLYLWRRPRSDAPPIATANDGGAAVSLAAAPDGGVVAAPAPALAAAPVVTLSDAKVMECHDPGSHHTPSDQCDHLGTVEKGLAAAIAAAGACVPPSASGGTLVYVVDASFARKHHPIDLLVPRDGRALKNPHATGAAVKECSAAVKRGIIGMSLEGIPHQHQRYKVAITATYAAPPGSGP